MNIIRRWFKERRERNCKDGKHTWTAETIPYRAQMERVKCKYCTASYILMKRK